MSWHRLPGQEVVGVTGTPEGLVHCLGNGLIISLISCWFLSFALPFNKSPAVVSERPPGSLSLLPTCLWNCSVTVRLNGREGRLLASVSSESNTWAAQAPAPRPVQGAGPLASARRGGGIRGCSSCTQRAYNPAGRVQKIRCHRTGVCKLRPEGA